MLLLWGHGNYAIVTPLGAFYASYNSADSVKSLIQSECKYKDGVLTIASTNSAINSTDATYSYQVL